MIRRDAMAVSSYAEQDRNADAINLGDLMQPPLLNDVLCNIMARRFLQSLPFEC